ncbi:MAG TPA: NAD-dependent epimerase/dehydratase family protein [Pyrinomonadaceae bacterium]|nr:NAD-dependent epimerase/dehydratase family protein [Pyrinomonadaceae bacterium]
MKLLIIGGTRFLGRHLVTAALEHNHEVTLFNRGTSSSNDLSHIETIHGDRKQDLGKLKGRQWDAVIDTCGYLPNVVKASAAALSDSVNRYVFISSISAYADFTAIGIDETAPLASLTADQLEAANKVDTAGQVTAVNYGKMYGGLKASCELAAEEVLPNRVLIIRPGLIVGPYDYSDRFTYWVSRVAGAGEVLAPGRPARYLQMIDVRDLAEWIVRMIEQHEIGVFNASGLANDLTMASVLEGCKTVSNSDASFTWVSDDFLLQEHVAPWGEMPLWMPDEAGPHLQGFMFMNCEKAIRAGLEFRPLNITIKDTLSWYQAEYSDRELKAGISREKEQGLLNKWREVGSVKLR